MAKRRAKFGTQESLPGMAGANGQPAASNPKIDGAAKYYAACRDKRMEANKDEKEAHDKLLQEMDKAGVEHYENGSIKVDLTASRKCKVSTENTRPTEGDEEE